MSQEKAILAHLMTGKSITPLEALAQHGCFRLASRISDLRMKGHVIETEIVERWSTGNGVARIAQYSLIKKPD